MDIKRKRCSAADGMLSVSFDIFMDNYFTFSRLLTHHGVNNIRATRVLNKNRLRKCTITGETPLQKKGTWPLCRVSQLGSTSGGGTIWTKWPKTA